MVESVVGNRLEVQHPARPAAVSIAAYRVVLVLFAVVTTCMDPKTGGRLRFGSVAMTALAAYFVYAAGIWIALVRGWMSPEREANVTTVADVVLGLLIVVATHAATSPYTVFLAFGVLAAGARGEYVRCLYVTGASVLGYLLLGWARLGADFYIMRPVYLGIMGLMLAGLGRSFTETTRRVTVLQERNRIARTLHDGYLQTVAGTTLQIEAARRMLQRGLAPDAERLLGELRDALDRDHDDLRAYVRTLAAVPERIRQPLRDVHEPRVAVDVSLDTTIPTFEWISNIVREALLNVRRHARATNAEVRLRGTDTEICLTLADDGIGFPDDAPLPWSIQSRVLEAGGTIRLDRDGVPGARLVIRLPREAA